MIVARPPYVPALPAPAPFETPALYSPYPGQEFPSGEMKAIESSNDQGTQALQRYPTAAMYTDPYGYHSFGIPSHASYYQEMLQSHAKMEHDRYLEARETIVARAEAAQEELLKREAVLAEKEATHKQHLEDREVLLRKAQKEWRPQVSAYASNQYPFNRSRFQQSRSPFAYEQTLLQKHRLDRSIKAYGDELSQLEMQRNRFEEELHTMVESRS